jgi:hypothetical protein
MSNQGPKIDLNARRRAIIARKRMSEAVNPKRRKEKAERLSLGIKTGKAYRSFKKAERREARACQ